MNFKIIWLLETRQGRVLAAFSTEKKAERYRNSLAKPNEWEITSADVDPEIGGSD